jgi:DNA-binding beta-propeller fold protein YncE
MSAASSAEMAAPYRRIRSMVAVQVARSLPASMASWIKRFEDVPSHMVLDPETGWLYVADTGNNRIAVLDTATGTRGKDLAVVERGTDHYEVDGADFWTLIEGSDHGIGQPSGLALVNDTLYVSDHGTGNILAFDLDGERLDWAATGRTGVMGLEVMDDSELWFVDADADEVVRVLVE